MGSVPENLFSHAAILDADYPVSSSSADQVASASQRANSARVKAFHFHSVCLLLDIKNFHLAISKSCSDFGLVAEETDRADVVRRVHGLIESLDLTEGTGPKVKGGL